MVYRWSELDILRKARNRVAQIYLNNEGYACSITYQCDQGDLSQNCNLDSQKWSVRIPSSSVYNSMRDIGYQSQVRIDLLYQNCLLSPADQSQHHDCHLA